MSVGSAVAEGRGDRNNDAPMPPIGNDDTLRPDTSPCDRRPSTDPAVLGAPSKQALRLQLPADPIAPSVARNRVRHWLTGSCWPPGQQEDIVLAVSEAVSNAVEHAYRDDQLPEVVDITGEVEAVPGGQRRVTVIVRDHGRWHAPPIDDDNRRRGIPLMRACVDTVTIGQPDDNRAGTAVVLRSRVVPSLRRALGALDNDTDPM
ncbi:MAG: ATP-binding protein [Pseudonocardiaceae bacterium]